MGQQLSLFDPPREEEPVRHSFFAQLHDRSFIVFNDGPLNMEPVTGEDLVPVQITPGSPFASAAWSCNCKWYFIVVKEGIILLNVYSNQGFLCRKRSARFIEHFLNAR